MPLLLHEDYCPYCEKWYRPIVEHNIHATMRAKVELINIRQGWDSRVEYIRNAIREQTGKSDLRVPLLYFEAYGKGNAIVGITTESYADGALQRLKEFYGGV